MGCSWRGCRGGGDQLSTRCELGLHDWPKWSEPFEMEVLGRRPGSTPYRADVQSRKCRRCGRIARKLVLVLVSRR